MGLGINQTKDRILVDQLEYIHQIKLIQIHKSRAFRKNNELTKEEKSQLRSFCGQIQWATSQTRPDLGFETCVMSNVGKHATVKDVDEANKALRKLQSKTVHLKFPNLGNPSKVQAIAYSDATYASLPDGSSQGALIIFLRENSCVAPISWQSKKLSHVTKSHLASEALALSEAADAGFLMASIWQEVFGMSVLPKVLRRTDNESLKEALYSSKVVSDRCLRVNITRLREMVEEDEIQVELIEKRKQLADCMTKKVASTVELLEVLSTSKL